MGKLKKKTRNPGVGIDFKKVKHKVGKKLPRAQNDTDTNFKSRSINLPNQAVREDRSNVAVNFQNLTLKELLNQTSHYNDKSRKHSLVGLADLFGRHPEQLRLHASQVLGTLAERIVDGDSSVRSTLRDLLNNSVLPVLGSDVLRPFMPVLMAHVCGAMTHLSLDVRNDALLFLDVMMDHVPQLVLDGFLAPCLAHFCDLFSAAHRSRSIRAQSLSSLTKLLTALTSFLKRAFPEDVTLSTASAGAQATAASGGGAHADMDMGYTTRGVRDAEAAAGPGPSSIRRQVQSLAAYPGMPLGADRMRRPQRPAGDLLRQLDALFRNAAAVTRSGRKQRRKSEGLDTADKNRHKKGRGSVSATETAAAAKGGKGVAAAAAALAAVTTPAAATAAGVGVSAASDAAAAGLLGARTAMAAALAAASDARASALRLVSLLMDCWLECSPTQLAISPELEQATALAMIAAACNNLIERLLLPRQAASGGAGQQHGVWQHGPPPSAEQRLALTQQLHDLVARRVAAHFPAVLPPVKPSPAVVEALVRLNLQSAELLGRFLPLLADSRPHHQPHNFPPAEPGASGNVTLWWVPALVSYYVGALEQGLLLPPAAKTLSDASSAAATVAQGMSAAAADALLMAVSVALGQLDDLAAARLMAAVAHFSARQFPRSGARLACIRMQHSLLRAAVGGRVCLADGAVASWLEPLPKMLWELGGGSPEISSAALLLLLDAARFAAPGSAASEFLSSALQPQLAPLFAVQLPPKAAKAAWAKYTSALASAALSGSGSGLGCASSETSGEVMVLLPGAVSKLPEPVGQLAVDLIYHTGALGAALLKPLAAALSSAALPDPLCLRLLDVVMARLRDAPDPALAASWLLTLFFGPQHGQRVLAPDGADLTASWDRQRALVDTAMMKLGRLGGAAPLLMVLAPQLAALPLAEVATAGARGARLQRYSLVRLCALALGETAGGDRLPAGLMGIVPAAAALCGLEAGVAVALAEAGLNGTAAVLPYSNTFGPVVQLLAERPALAMAVIRHLLALLRQMAQPRVDQAPMACVTLGSLPLHTAALVGLQLAQTLVKLQPVRLVLAASAADRECLASLVKELSEAAHNLPVAAAGTAGSDHAAACGLESQRLLQTVGDLFGNAAAA
ncbi:hypothetical protein VaNZ11_007270 [Volvox africanus]|uniref:Pre-rRNA-processing protein Ipi1 N-terminal domain-containing protein n=1 Tax=Volvox africanus TaxID=51714 RepID=A0ABQ5S2I2_9CHLO|nr:hypothetical protein VaNZ11_007270 [Volvox africanus]